VVDDESTDGTVRIAGKYTDKIYSTAGKGLAYARQLGAEKAKSNYVCYVDSDFIIPQGCLSKMAEELDEKGYVAIHAQTVSLATANYWEWAVDQHFRMMFNKEGRRKSIGTGAAIYKRDAILEYRFDPFFSGAAEDHDLCYRLRKNGLTLGISSAFAYHQHRASASAFIKQRIWYGRGAARYFWKHKSITWLLSSSSLPIPFGVLVCIRRRSLKIFPYYLVWSISSSVGILRELPELVLRKLVPSIR